MIRMIPRLAFAVVDAILIVTFGFQFSRVDGFSMAPTLEDRDRLLVNKFVYEFSDPRPGDVVMFYYPPDPARMFVKRVIATGESPLPEIVDGRVLVDRRPVDDDYVAPAFRDHDNWGPEVIGRLRLRHGRPPQRRARIAATGSSVPKRYKSSGKVRTIRWWRFRPRRIFLIDRERLAKSICASYRKLPLSASKLHGTPTGE